MLRQYSVPYYKYKLCRKTLATVFNSVHFEDKKLKEILHDSYLVNLNTMIQYACENNIDEVAYILEIKRLLNKHER